MRKCILNHIKLRYSVELLRLSVLCITLLSTLFGFASGMDQLHEDIASIAEKTKDMSMAELKQHADSMHASQDINVRTQAHAWYYVGMERNRENFTAKDYELLAAMYSNYAAYLIYDLDNSVMAFPYLIEAMDIENTKCPDDYSLCQAYLSMGRIYLNYGNFDKAVEVLKKGLQRNLQSSQPERANYAFVNMLSDLWGADLLDSIQDEIDEWAGKPITGKPGSRISSLQAKGAIALRNGDYDSAASFLIGSLKDLDVEYTHGKYIMTTYLMLIDVYLRNGNLSKAWEYIEATAGISGADYDFHNRERRNKLIERYYRLKGDVMLADRVLMKNFRLRDSLYNAHNQTLVSEFEHRHLMAALNEDLKVSERERTFLKTSNRIKTIAILVVSISAILVIGLLLWLLRKSRRLRETSNALFRKNLETIRPAQMIPSTVPQANAGQEDPSHGKKEPDTNGLTHDSSDNSLERLRDVYARIIDFCEKSREIYQLDFDIAQMSELTGIRQRDISQAVNTVAGKNFRSFIVEQRVKEACRIIIEAEETGKEHMKFDTLAVTVGFRSRTHFSAAFKSVTGMTYTEFFRQARREVL